MKELEVTVRIRNNRLKERRDDLGWTQREMAKAIGCNTHDYGCLETMRTKSRDAQGCWRKIALALATFHAVPVEELFPASVDAVDVPVAVRRLDAADLPALMSDSQHLALASPEERVADVEAADELERLLAELDPTLRGILRRRFWEGKTLEEVARDYNLSPERIRQKEVQALAEIRESKKWSEHRCHVQRLSRGWAEGNRAHSR